jgi:DNA-binding XRE family transcriptional regulator
MDATQYKALRERLGLTQAGLALRLGVSRRTIIFRETGARITEEAALAIRALAASTPK